MTSTVPQESLLKACLHLQNDMFLLGVKLGLSQSVSEQGAVFEICELAIGVKGTEW